MTSDDHTLNSEPTMAFGYRPTPQDEPSFGSAPTMVPGNTALPHHSTTALSHHRTTAPSFGRIDQYELIRKLGGGGFGVVYLARDTVSGIDVALKTLHPLLKSNPEEMEALRAKFALVARLSHPNIASALVLHPCRDIAITDDGVRNEMRLSPGDFIMVMRYAPGVTLSKWRRQFPDGVVPLDQALEVACQVASALDYAHGERIVHRDIKPANIMVETLGGGESHTEPQRHREGVERIRVRILDFGLAAEIRSSMSRVSTETGDTSGTRPYMAPEQWLGRKQDGRTDQYALACVLYELLSGAPPFAGAFETGDPVIMMATVKGEAPEEVEGVPAHVNAALLKALAKNPKERFASCAEFVESCFGPQRTQSSQRETHAEPRKKSGKGWLVAALGAAAVAAGLWFASGNNGGAGSPGESQPVEARASSSVTQSVHVGVGVQLWAGGPYWAETNIGAEKPEDYGLYFWWGDTIGYRREGNAWVASDGSSRNFEFSEDNTPTYGKNNATLRHEGWMTSSGVLSPVHDAAHVHWGGGWRMPTKQELDDLGSKCDWTWTTQNGVKGYVVKGRGAYAGASIFLPAAGYGHGASLDYAGSFGNYWSSVPYSDYGSSWRLYFTSGYHVTSNYYRSRGQSVRPVLGFAK